MGQGMRNVWILTISMCLLAICYTMIVPFLPVFLLELGVAPSGVPLWSGVVFSITFLVAGIMAPIWGKMADKRGRKMMILRAGFFIGIAYILTGMVTDAWQLLIARAIQGFANGFMPAAMTLVSLSVSPDKAGVALGIFQTGLVLGNVIGPFLGGLVASAVSMRTVYYISAAVVFAATAMVLFFVKEAKIPTVKADKDSGSIRQDILMVWKNPLLRRLMFLFFIMQACILMLQPILALYVGEMLGSMTHAAMVTGTILSIGGLAGVVTTNLWARFGQDHGYFRAITLAISGTGIALMLQSLPMHIWVFGALQVLIGCCIVGINPALSASVTVSTEPNVRGRVFGMATTAQQFGSTAGPLFASALMTLVDINFVFLTTGILLCAVGINLYMTCVRGKAPLH